MKPFSRMTCQAVALRRLILVSSTRARGHGATRARGHGGLGTRMCVLLAPSESERVKEITKMV